VRLRRVGCALPRVLPVAAVAANLSHGRGASTARERAWCHLYGGSLGLTVLKELAIGVIYGFVSFVAFIAMMYWVSIAG
jgi:hypothetical protein